MTTDHYPAFSELNIAPDFLLIGVSVMHHLVARGYMAAEHTPIRALSPEDRRAYDRQQRRAWASRMKFGGRRIAWSSYRTG
jgi:hypothetical protein